MGWTLKTKIRIILLAAFLAMSLVGVLGSILLDRVADSAIRLMEENKRSVEYVEEMSLALGEALATLSRTGLAPMDRRIKLVQDFSRFEFYLEYQEKNCKTAEELVFAADLRLGFENFRQASMLGLDEAYTYSQNLRQVLDQLYQFNEARMKKRIDEAYTVSNMITAALVITAFAFFIFAVITMFYFPDYIANPIVRLTQSIKEIANRNYDLRLEVNSTDEFGEMAKAFNEMAEKLAEYEKLNVAKLLVEKSRIETIIRQMNEAIIGLDPRNTVLFANPKALQLLGLREEELVGRSAGAAARGNEALQQVLREILEVSGKGEARTVPAFSMIQNGHTYYFEKDILPIRALGQTGGEGFVVILKNITEFQERDLAKTHFMATLSHELKTPISAIDMSLGLLSDDRIGPLNEEQQDLAHTIRQNSERLLKMVNEILDMSKIEAGALEVKKEPVAPAEVVEKALESVETFFAEKSLQIEKRLSPLLPVLQADLQKTTAILVNFLTNAIRYSPTGGFIRIEVSREAAGVSFEVSDQGPGIAPEDQEQIFQRYRRLKDDRTKGTGLGLAISKEFVEMQGGRIWVRSQPGQGSTFGFLLPHP